MSQSIGKGEKIGSVADHNRFLSSVDRKYLLYLALFAGSCLTAVGLSIAFDYQYQQGVDRGIEQTASKIIGGAPFKIRKTSRNVYQCGRVNG